MNARNAPEASLVTRVVSEPALRPRALFVCARATLEREYFHD